MIVRVRTVPGAMLTPEKIGTSDCPDIPIPKPIVRGAATTKVAPIRGPLDDDPTSACPAIGSREVIVARNTPPIESTLRPVTSGSNQSFAIGLHLRSRMLSRDTVPLESGAVSRATSNGISTVIGPENVADEFRRIGSDKISSPDGGVAVARGPASGSRRVTPGSVTRSKVIFATVPSPGAAIVTELPRKVSPTGVAVRVGVKVDVEVIVAVRV